MTDSHPASPSCGEEGVVEAGPSPSRALGCLPRGLPGGGAEVHPDVAGALGTAVLVTLSAEATGGARPRFPTLPAEDRVH